MKGRGDDRPNEAPAAFSSEGTRESTTPAHGIRVHVMSMFLPEHSNIPERRWAFSYTVTISNVGVEGATLLARHWIVSDGNGAVEHVRGPGVVGQQPCVEGGRSFVYTSGAVLRTPFGLMQGEYLMERADGTRFDALIPPFALATPEAVH